MGRGVMLNQTFVFEVSNKERKILTHHNIIDHISEKIVSVCKEWKLWIHPNLRRPNFSFTYPSMFSDFCIVDIWPLKKELC